MSSGEGAPNPTQISGRETATVAQWVVSCAMAEGIGMTASAVASRVAEDRPIGAALTLVVLGGLIEGLALGLLQASWLARRFPGINKAAWVIGTVLVAGVGWAAASSPSLLGRDGGTQPAPALLAVMAGGLGAVMGALLGAVQSFVLRRHVAHAWRWVGVSALAWAPAMVVIFVGATAPDETWRDLAVILLAAITGVVAGGVLGIVSGPLISTLDSRPVSGPKTQKRKGVEADAGSVSRQPPGSAQDRGGQP